MFGQERDPTVRDGDASRNKDLTPVGRDTAYREDRARETSRPVALYILAKLKWHHIAQVRHDVTSRSSGPGV